MTLHVGLGQHVHAVFVAEVVEYRIIGVVRGADGIDVQSLHGFNVAFNLLRCDGSSVDGGEVVTVDAVEHHTLAVDGQGTVVADGYFTETYLRTANVDDIAIGIFQRQDEVIEVGCLGAPKQWSRDVHVEGDRSLPKPLRRNGS